MFTEAHQLVLTPPPPQETMVTKTQLVLTPPPHGTMVTVTQARSPPYGLQTVTDGTEPHMVCRLLLMGRNPIWSADCY